MVDWRVQDNQSHKLKYPLLEEVLVARWALIFALELGFDQVILEGNSEIAIQAMNSADYMAAPFGHIIVDIKALSSHFRSLVFRHTHWLGNRVAHRLARAACNFSSSFCTWIEEVPVCTYGDYFAEIINTTWSPSLVEMGFSKKKKKVLLVSPKWPKSNFSTVPSNKPRKLHHFSWRLT